MGYGLEILGLNNEDDEPSEKETQQLNVKQSLDSNASINSMRETTKIALSQLCSLNLSKCNLSELPLNQNFYNLKFLNLSNNKFKQVPACLYNGLKQLKLLDLSYNHITIFDREPDCIRNVEFVYLHNNKLQNVPRWFLNFKATNLLEFSYNNNMSTHFNYLKKSFNCLINKLNKLELRNCQMIDNDYIFLRQFKKLSYLDIGNVHDNQSNQFYELDNLFISLTWKQLKVLKVDYLGLSVLPSGILWLESLVELHVNDNCISWLPDDIKYMINLEFLDVSRNSLVALPEALINLKELKVINASDNHIQSIPDFSQMPIKILDLYNNYLEQISCNICNLQYVDLEMNLFDTSSLQKFSEYREKRENYIQKLNNSERTHCFRQEGIKVCYSELTSDSDKEYDEEVIGYEYVDKEPSQQNFTNEESWEQDHDLVQKYKRSPEVDTDDDWDGEERCDSKYTNKCLYEKIYVLDEDWMFEDADESY